MKAAESPGPEDWEPFNQPPPLEEYNLFEQDLPLREALRREGGAWIEKEASSFGEVLGRAATLRLGELANRCAPVLRTHDRNGRRIDEVEFHPAWHELMRLGIERGVHSLPWTVQRPGAYVARAVLTMLRHQLDEGTGCPLSMTFASVPSLRVQPELADEWEPGLLANEYDPRFIPAPEKKGLLIGMAMTERQGGSDVRANLSRARPTGRRGPGEAYQITGHKWFCSAPMCDAFLVLAQAEGGLSCFLLPRWNPDGTRNAFHIVRLKDKLGNRSNASSEVEFQGAWCRLVGEEGRGVATIIEMVRHTRLDCVLGSAATLRRAVAEATHYAARRFAFSRQLADQPLMKNVLADLCLESEAATAAALRLARSYDEAASDEREKKLSRLATAVLKYWVTRRAIAAVAEALEVIGGNGYVEEFPMARLYRDVPLNSIWEGSGNIQCLDVLRTIRRDPETVDAFLEEVRPARGPCRELDALCRKIERELCDLPGVEAGARRIVEWMALALQASVLVRHAPAAVADAFCAARICRDQGLVFGTLPSGTDFDAIIARSTPRLA
ncbi:MAG: acyl-CoA dehydrogenase family protein [bacterium]